MIAGRFHPKNRLFPSPGISIVHSTLYAIYVWLDEVYPFEPFRHLPLQLATVLDFLAQNHSQYVALCRCLSLVSPSGCIMSIIPVYVLHAGRHYHVVGLDFPIRSFQPFCPVSALTLQDSTRCGSAACIQLSHRPFCLCRTVMALGLYGHPVWGILWADSYRLSKSFRLPGVQVRDGSSLALPPARYPQETLADILQSIKPDLGFSRLLSSQSFSQSLPLVACLQSSLSLSRQRYLSLIKLAACQDALG
jgi:hypothetical protein